MPNLINLKLSSAQNLLIRYDLVLGNIYREKSYKFEKDFIIKQAPYEPDEEVSPGETIDIWVSEGYPDEAKIVTDRVYVESRTDGLTSEVVIIVSDARGDDIEVLRKQMKSSTEFQFEVVLSPRKNAQVKVMQDGYLVNSHEVNYSSANSN